MLTPEQINEYRKKYGIGQNKPTQSILSADERINRLRGLISQPSEMPSISTTQQPTTFQNVSILPEKRIETLKGITMETPTIETPTTKEPGFVQSMIQSITRPFAKATITGTKAVKGTFQLAELLGVWAGGDEKRTVEVAKNLAKTASNEAIDLGYLGNVKDLVSDKNQLKNWLDIIGTGIEIGAWVGGKPITGLTKEGIKIGAKELVKMPFKEAMIIGAKTGAKQTAVFGGVTALGRSIQDEVKSKTKPLLESLVNIGIQTSIGTGMGSVVGAITGAISGAITKVIAGKTEKIATNIYNKELQPKLADITADIRKNAATIGQKIKEEVDNKGIPIYTGTYEQLKSRAEGQVMSKLPTLASKLKQYDPTTKITRSEVTSKVLQQIKDEYISVPPEMLKISQILAKQLKPEMNMTEAQASKRFLDKFISNTAWEKVFRGTDINLNNATVLRIAFRTVIRNLINEKTADPVIQTLNKSIGLAIDVNDLVSQQIALRALWKISGQGGFAYKIIGKFIDDVLLNPSITTRFAQFLDKSAGKGIEKSAYSATRILERLPSIFRRTQNKEY